MKLVKNSFHELYQKEHTQQLFERLMQGCKVHHPRKKHSLLLYLASIESI